MFKVILKGENMKNKMSKEEKEWLDNPTINIIC